MNKEIIKEILYILIAIIVGILAVNFVIWLLPIVLIAVVEYFIYKSIKKNKDVSVNVNKNNNNKNIKVIHDLDDEDK